LPERGTAVGRAASEGKIIHIPDVFEDKEYSSGTHNAGGYRSVLGVWATPGVFERRPVVTVTASDDYFPQRKNSARFLPRFDTSISQPGLPCPGDG
jgi:hypothetical protein